MSNSYTSPPTLADPATVTSGQPITELAPSRMGDLQNYIAAVGGCTNLINQCWDNGVFASSSATQVHVLRYRAPAISRAHLVLKVYIVAKAFTAAGSIEIEATDGTSTLYHNVACPTGLQTLTFTLTFPGAALASDMIDLEVDIINGSGGSMEIRTIMAEWSAVASPITLLMVSGADTYKPMGINRLSTPLPLSSRFGVNSINNISMMRKRARVFLSWAGCLNLAVTSQSSKGIGIGDIPILFSDIFIPDGVRDDDDLKLYAEIYVEQATVLDPMTVLIMGNRIEISSNGWSQHELDLNPEPIASSRRYGLPMYRVGFDDVAVNQSNLDKLSTQAARNGTGAIITGLTIWGGC